MEELISIILHAFSKDLSNDVDRIDQLGSSFSLEPSNFAELESFAWYVSGFHHGLDREGRKVVQHTVITICLAGGELGLRPIAAIAAAEIESIEGRIRVRFDRSRLASEAPAKYVDPVEDASKEVEKTEEPPAVPEVLELDVSKLDDLELDRRAHWSHFKTIGKDLGHSLHRRCNVHTARDAIAFFASLRWYADVEIRSMVDEDRRVKILGDLWAWCLPLDEAELDNDFVITIEWLNDAVDEEDQLGEWSEEERISFAGPFLATHMVSAGLFRTRTDAVAALKYEMLGMKNKHFDGLTRAYCRLRLRHMRRSQRAE